MVILIFYTTVFGPSDGNTALKACFNMTFLLGFLRILG